MNDPSRRFERAGFTFEVLDESKSVIPGSQFSTESNGRGVCPVELPTGHTYTLVETASPQANIQLVQQEFTMDKPNLLLRVENVFSTPPPPGAYGGI